MPFAPKEPLMALYVVRHIDDKQAVGFFWAESDEDMLYMVDDVSNASDCEFQMVDGSAAFVWDGRSPGLGVRRDEVTAEYEICRLMASVGARGAIEHYLNDETPQSDWTPLQVLMETMWPLPRPVKAPKQTLGPVEEERVVLPRRSADSAPLVDRVYFIECDGHVKIGITSGRIEKRLKALSTGHHKELTLLATVENAPGPLEAELHQRFAQYRVRGEWFVLSPEIQAYIDELKVKE